MTTLVVEIEDPVEAFCGDRYRHATLADDRALRAPGGQVS